MKNNQRKMDFAETIELNFFNKNRNAFKTDQNYLEKNQKIFLFSNESYLHLNLSN